MEKNHLILSGCLVIDNKKRVLLLYRRDHRHYETPGGKLKPEDCENIKDIGIVDLSRTAKRELHEELGAEFETDPLVYFGSVEFKTPDGRIAIANKFITQITSGTPKVNEPKIFEKFEYIKISELEKYNLSPDLKLLLPKIKKELG
ncbi:MAG: NUDIX hydrolase [Candidatus Nanoarchaeia archaeon]